MDPIDPTPTEFNFLTRILIWIAGCDEGLLLECPSIDLGYVRSTALLYLGVFLYQSMVLAVVAHVLFAHDGQVHPALIVGPVFIGALIYLIDSYAFLRGGHFTDGVRDLLKGGMDIGEGILGKFRSFAFLCLRILFSIALALLTGVWVGMIIFGEDIIDDIDTNWRAKNIDLINGANERVDSRIRAASNALQISTTHLSALQHQVDTAQNGIVDPASGAVGVNAEEAEFQQLLAEKSRRDAELTAAQNFASDELGGAKGPGHSGVPGDGPVRRAAVERLKTAQASDDSVTKELDAARGRLDSVRTQLASGANDRVGSAKAMLPALQADLKAERAEVVSQREALAQLTNQRDRAVQQEIENDPEYVAPDHGMLARLEALEAIADQDRKIAAVILLIDAASMGLELAAVMVKVTTYIPTSYCPLLAQSAYLNLITIVDEMEAAMRRKRPEQDMDEDPTADSLPPISPGGGSERGTETNVPPVSDIFPVGGIALNGSGTINGSGAKRPRGRPRKDRLQ